MAQPSRALWYWGVRGAAVQTKFKSLILGFRLISLTTFPRSLLFPSSSLAVAHADYSLAGAGAVSGVFGGESVRDLSEVCIFQWVI